jgi:biopolymer transport protein ExbD
MLIITIPVQLHAVNLNLPVKPPLTPPAPPVVVRLDIDAANAVYWNGERLADRAAMELRMQAAAIESPQPEVHLRPDPRSRYQTTAEVLVSANRIGLTRLGVLGNDAVAGR